MDVLISGSAGPAQGGWTVRPNRPVSLSGGPLGSEGRVQHWIQVQFQWAKTRWTDVKAMLGMESWGHKPTCRGPTICPGAPHPFDIGGGAGGASPLSQANRVVRPGPAPCRQQLCSDLSSYCSTHPQSTGHVCMYCTLSRLAGASTSTLHSTSTRHGHHLTRDMQACRITDEHGNFCVFDNRVPSRNNDS